MDFIILAILVACFIVGLIASFHQYIQHRKLEKQKLLLSLKQKIKETEQILENAIALSLSKGILITLEKRILQLLQQILSLNPQGENQEKVEIQLSKVKETTSEKLALSYFVLPSNRKTAVLLLQNYRALKRILRDELSKNQIDLSSFRKEMRQISYYCDLILIREKLQNISFLLQQKNTEQAAYLFGLLQQEADNQQLLDSFFQDETAKIKHALINEQHYQDSTVF